MKHGGHNALVRAEILHMVYLKLFMKIHIFEKTVHGKFASLNQRSNMSVFFPRCLRVMEPTAPWKCVPVWFSHSFPSAVCAKLWQWMVSEWSGDSQGYKEQKNKHTVICCLPLTPMSDQDIISPYNINTISSRQVIRKEKYMLGDYKLIQYQILQSNITRTHLGELLMRSWELKG